MIRNRWLIAVTLVLMALGLLIIWRIVTAPPPPPPFRTAAVSRGRITESVTANGVLGPIRVVNVGTQVSGTVESLDVDFNDPVEKGQVLLRLDPALFASRLAASEAALAQARAQAALQAANVRRAQDLVTRDYISQQEYETLVANARGAAAQVAAASAQVAQDRANLDFSVIRAPVSGVVISREVDLGQTVAAAFNTPTLFTIALDLARMQIEASVAEADIARVRPGQRVVFTVDAYPERSFEGAVKQIRLNPVTQQNVVTYTVVVEAENPDGTLLPGMTADARFIVTERADALLLPNGALGFRPEAMAPVRDLADDEAIVFVDESGQPAPRRIRLGVADTENSEILEGPLKAGESVITGLNTSPGGGMFSGPPGQQPRDRKGGTETSE
ncbi:MAG: efflux RND transporter periplasmic adaptor subunit [Polymorphobacter sp.]|uniref:efflux RND transporter periplasmic adaptor subunit n=1 Tax=Polymorphobacter sp. TaxID=1909290 RepID=UPI003A88FF0D